VRQHASLEGSLTLDFESFGLTGPSRLTSLAPQDDGRDLARSSPIQLSDSHAPSPVFFGRPRAGPRRRVQFFAPPRGERSAGRRGGLRDPRWMAGETIRWDACEASPRSSSERGASRRSTAAFCDKDGPRFRERGPSHACQPAPGAGSYCPGAEPRHRPGAKGYVCLRPAAPHQPTAGFPRLADPASSEPYLRPSLTAAPSSRRPMTTPLEEQDWRIIGPRIGSVNSPT
jgi:hypothetical protein